MYYFAFAGLLGILSLLPLAASAQDHAPVQRADGSIIQWYLDHPQHAEKSALIILAQGSGCRSVTMSENIKRARSVFKDFSALTVEKYGVATGDNPQDPFDKGCSEVFRAHHSMSQRVEDYLQVLTSLKEAEWWNGKLVLFGGSEGGDVVARLAAKTNADAVVLLSTGGGTSFGDLVRQSIEAEMLLNNVPREQWPPVDQVFAHARANPHSSETWGGSSYRFWADAIDQRPVDGMLQSDAALLLIQGSADTSAPVDNARMVPDIFAKAKRCNLAYWELAGYDHVMHDAQGNNRLPEVLAQADFWVKQQLTGTKPLASCSSQ